MKTKLTTALYLIVGLINFAPLMGVLGAGRLRRLYEIDVLSPDLLLLLQHRAVLFGIVGGLLLVAAARKSLRPVAATAGMISMVSYILILLSGEPVNAALIRIAYADAVAILLLVAALLMERKDQSP
jgi:hypothetical protein